MTKFTKDPSTHPANGPLTEERLIRVRDELAAAAKRSDGGNLGYMMADAAKAIDELFTSMEQEPVAYAPKGHIDRYLRGDNSGCWVYGHPVSDDDERLYRASQISPFDRRAIASKVQGLCSRLPGATFANAAEFTLDEIEAPTGQEEPVSQSFKFLTLEHIRVIEMLLSVCGAAFELADDSCQQQIDGEDCHIVPDTSFAKLSDTLDEIEDTLPYELPNTILQWAAIPRYALRGILYAAPQFINSNSQAVSLIDRICPQAAVPELEQFGAEFEEVLAEGIDSEMKSVQTSSLEMKDHEIREMVNDLRDIAVNYHNTQQLREHIARTVRNALSKARIKNDDTKRMDWLVSHWVEVREPLLYGSKAMFYAQEVSDEADEHYRNDLREKIDEYISGDGK